VNNHGTWITHGYAHSVFRALSGLAGGLVLDAEIRMHSDINGLYLHMEEADQGSSEAD
jgi:hypothetical protein